MMTTRRNVIAGSLSTVAAASLARFGSAAASTPTPAGNASAPRYQAGSAERRLDIINLHDLEQEASKLIPKPQFGYISSGSGDEWTLRENMRSFHDVQVLPRYLAGVDQPDASTTLLGSAVALPVFIPPMAAHGLAHRDAERATAKGAADAGALFTAQTLANVPLADIGRAGDGPKWFQLYYTKDHGVNRELIAQAKAMGATAIVFTVDLEWAGNREADARNGFVFPPSLAFPNVPGAPQGATLAELFTVFKRNLDFRDLEFIARESGLPVVVKGIQTADNAREAIAHGAAAIQVSNHGGRQLDGVPAAFTSLPWVVEAAAGRVPVYLDGGIRRGIDVFKALAMGADGVAVGRPVLYGLALGGAGGVTSVLETLKTELRLAMKLAGTANIEQISRTFVT